MQRPDNASLIRYAGIAAQVVVGVIAVTIASVLVVPRIAGWDIVTVLSGSMTPTYPTDSVLAIESIDPAKIEAGDVIAFKPEPDAAMVTHRVVSVDESETGLSFVTKGDANEDPDSNPVLASAVHGRVVFGVPLLGKLIRTAHTPFGFFVLLVLPALFVIVHEARSIRRTLREGREDGAATDETAAAALPSAIEGAAPLQAERLPSAAKRQLLLITVAAAWANRQEILELATLSGGAVVAVGHTSMAFSIVAEPTEVSAFERLISRFGVLAAERSAVLDVPMPADAEPEPGVLVEGPDFDRIIAEGFGEEAEPVARQSQPS
jgi:signal peptidase I